MSAANWASKWAQFKDQGKFEDAFEAAAKVYEACWGGTTTPDLQFVLHSAMFHDLGDGYVSRQNYIEAAKVYQKGSVVFARSKEEAALFEEKYKKTYQRVIDGLCETETSSTKDEKKEKKKKKKKNKNKPTIVEGVGEITEVDSEGLVGEVEEVVDTRAPTTIHEQEDNLLFDGWMFSQKIDFSIDTYLGDGFYQGLVTSSSSKFRKLYIEPARSQISGFSLLQHLVPYGNFVRVDYFIESVDTRPPLLVAEDVYPLDYFFKVKLKSFLFERSKFSLEDNKVAWWELIANDFIQIFRDIVHAVMMIYSSENASLGGVCGHLKRNMYVTMDGRGKILPSLDGSKEIVEDLEDIVEKMKFIIGLISPEPISGINDLKVFGVSDELVHFIDTDFGIKLQYVPAFWLVNPSCLWISSERASFVHKLRYLMKRNAIQRRILGDSLDFCETFAEHQRQNTHWSDQIGNELFRKIFDKKKGVANYADSIDIVRYMGACYAHVNEREYVAFRGLYLTYSEDDVEKILRSFYPNIILELSKALYDYAVHRTYKDSREKDTFLKALKDLSSCSFNRDLHRAL